MKIKIHPFFIVVAALTVWKFGIAAFVTSVAATLLHECAHAFAAKNRGYVADEIMFFPYGAVLYNRFNTDRISNVIIALAGPLFNFALSLICVASWWLFPASYYVTQSFVAANVAIGIFNLLPVWPLDGGRVIFALFSYKPRVLTYLKAAACALAITLAALFCTLTRFENYSLMVMAVFLFSGAIAKTPSEDYRYALNNSPVVKDYANGVFAQTVYLDENTSLKKALLMVKPDRILSYKITKNGRVTAELSENEMIEIFNTNKLSEKLSSVIPRKYPKA